MTELETMQRAKMYLDKLARGIDPISNQEMPEDAVLNNVRICRWLHYVSGGLEQVIANGGTVGKREGTPFVIDRSRTGRSAWRCTPAGQEVASWSDRPFCLLFCGTNLY